MAILKGWQNSPGMGLENSPGYFEVLEQAQHLNFVIFLCDKDPSNIIKKTAYVNKIGKYHSRVQNCQFFKFIY